jgi:hypothetical protein
MLSGKLTMIAFLVAGALAAGASAQARKPDVKRDAKRADERAAPSVSLVERTPADYLSGEANVAVRGNQNPVIKLGLSPNGATIIEFPASDKLFNIIPGNSNLVTIEESPTKETDRFVIVRPGDGFSSPTTMAQARRQPATSVIVQMTSGLVITFLFYPVPQLAEQAHRVVVTYDRNEVIAARRAAGLAVNLDSAVEDKARSTSSLRVVAPSNSAGPVTAGPARPAQGAGLARPLSGPDSQPPLSEKADQKKVDLDAVASEALDDAVKWREHFKKWSGEAHGLSISVSPVRELDGRLQVVVIAVRNAKKADARVVPGQPEIYVQTDTNNGRLVTVDSVKKLASRTTAVDGLIPAGGKAYYAIVYEAPILGARQRLRVAVGKTTAADEPTTALLNDESRKEGGH